MNKNQVRLDDFLQPEDRLLWAEYEELRRRGLRKQAHEPLRLLIDHMLQYPVEQRRAWVEAFAVARWDEGQELPIQHHLALEVLVPELYYGFKEGRPTYARWLGQALSEGGSQPPFSKGLTALGAEDLHAYHLFREALRLDPHDGTARDEMMDILGRWLDFYIHEVPSGILAEPEELRAELEEFKALAAARGDAGRYAQQLPVWEFHCTAWADYLARKPEFASYRDYLMSVVPDWRASYR